MNKKFTFITMLLSTSFISRAQITINSSDIPMPATFNINVLPLPNAPTKGSNQVWNFSTATPTSNSTNVYTTENLAQWTGIGVDVYVGGFKSLNASFGYNFWSEIDKAATGMLERGMNISPEAYGLGTYTGTTTDSIIFPEQDIFYANPKTLMPFPMTSSYTNQYISGRNVVNFTLNAPALGLVNTPCQQAFYEFRKDSIVGWGTLRVYTPNGPSAPYDVLMDKVTSYSIDSFYVGGAPASTALKSAFSISQGQKSTIRNYYNFYRKGSFNYLLRLFYDTDTTFTTMTDAFSHADNVAPTGVSSNDKFSYTTMVYPNPCNQSNIHIKVLGQDVSSLTKFSITNLNGQIVASGVTTWNQDELILPTSKLPQGNYVMSVFDEHTSVKISESFQMQ